MAQVYPGLAQVRDPVLRAVLKTLFDQTGALQQQAAGIGTVTAPLPTHLDGNGKQVKAIAAPSADGDAVNLVTMRRYVEAAVAKSTEDAATAVIVTSPYPPGPPVNGDGGQAQSGVLQNLPTGHVSGSDLTAYRAGEIIGGTAHEWAALTAITATQAARDANQLELLLRTIWHLAAGGFTVGRQRNPSGILSTDKIAITVDGVLRAYDCYSGAHTAPMVVQALEVAPANLVTDSGTAD